MDMFEQRPTYDYSKLPSEEPIGIVISRGVANEVPPRLRAYVWGEAPALDATPTQAKAP